MTTEKADKVIAHANAVFQRLDTRKGPVRDAAARERQRLNSDFMRRAARVGVAIGIVSLLTIIVGLITPIGMFGFLAAIGLAIGTSFYWLGLIVGIATAIILFIADMFPGTRQQIEEHAEKVEQKVEQAEQRADQAERQIGVK